MKKNHQVYLPPICNNKHTFMCKEYTKQTKDKKRPIVIIKKVIVTKNKIVNNGNNDNKI